MPKKLRIDPLTGLDLYPDEEEDFEEDEDNGEDNPEDCGFTVQDGESDTEDEIIISSDDEEDLDFIDEEDAEE